MICPHLLAPCFLSCSDICKGGPSASSAPSFPPLHHYLLMEIFLTHSPRLSLVPFTCAAVLLFCRTYYTKLCNKFLLNLIVPPLDLEELKGRKGTVLWPSLYPQCLALRLVTHTHTHAHVETQTCMYIALFDIFPSTQKVENSEEKILAQSYHLELQEARFNLPVS